VHFRLIDLGSAQVVVAELYSSGVHGMKGAVTLDPAANGRVLASPKRR